MAQQVIRWSDDLDFDGVLIFTGAGAVLDPWIVATSVAASTQRLEPLVALNPLYTHPFAAARSLLSIAELYSRRVNLNLITGAALSELAAVGDTLNHGDRYQRLSEYVGIFLRLLDGGPVTTEGRFYVADNLQLSPALSAPLRPRLYLAGQSLDAAGAATETGASRIGMLSPDYDSFGAEFGAVNFGLVVRETTSDACSVAKSHFPEDPDGHEMLQLVMANTDSVWKAGMAASSEGVADSPFSLRPFRTFAADCPYLVGDYETVVDCIARIIEGGVHTLILDTPPTRDEFERLSEVMQAVRCKTGLSN